MADAARTIPRRATAPDLDVDPETLFEFGPDRAPCLTGWQAQQVATAQRVLVVLRHAKSDWPEEVSDADRPLAKRGRQDAPAVGAWLREQVGPIGFAVCSTALRARQTWTLAAAELAQSPATRLDGRVYAATAAELLTVVRELPGWAHTVALVGHNPGLQDLVGLLAGQQRELKTSSIAVLSWAGGWAEADPGSASLDALVTPSGR